MNALAFVDALGRLCPGKEFYLARGYEEEQVMMSMGCYVLPPVRAFSEEASALDTLRLNFDLQYFCVGWIELVEAGMGGMAAALGSVLKDRDGYAFGGIAHFCGVIMCQT